MVLPTPPGARKVRKQLSADALDALLGQSFARIPDHRQLKPPIPLRDALLSAFAMFSLKDPSLLAFDQRRNDANLKALFGIGQIPSDTQTREILDPFLRAAVVRRRPKARAHVLTSICKLATFPDLTFLPASPP